MALEPKAIPRYRLSQYMYDDMVDMAAYMTGQDQQAIDPQACFIDGPELPGGITRFWLVRHGIVTEPARKTMYGTLDVPLCETALKEQAPAYQSLARKLPRTSLWFSSPLKRACDTARVIQQAGGFSIPVLQEKAFGEQCLGLWNGVSHQDFPALVRQAPHPFWSISPEERPPQGESMEDVRCRIGAKLGQLAEEHAGHDMIIVSHGGAIRMALACALGISPEQGLYFTIQNLSCSIVEHIAGRWRVISVNALPDFGSGSAIQQGPVQELCHKDEGSPL